MLSGFCELIGLASECQLEDLIPEQPLITLGVPTVGGLFLAGYCLLNKNRAQVEVDVKPTLPSLNADELAIDIQNISAIKHYLGRDKEGVDLRQFAALYSNNALRCIVHSQENKHAFLRAIFFHDDVYQELTQFNIVKNRLNRPALFISKELGDGAGQNHYIFGIAYNDLLLIINPAGKTNHLDFYEKIERLQREGYFSRIYVSTTQLQKDPQGFVSCGPICAELAEHFAKMDPQTLFAQLPQYVGESKDKVQFVDVQRLLPESLNKLLSCTPRRYQDHVCAIRQSHLHPLVQACSQYRLITDREAYFETQCINAPTQRLVAEMLLEHLSPVTMEKSDAFNELSKSFGPKLKL